MYDSYNPNFCGPVTFVTSTWFPLAAGIAANKVAIVNNDLRQYHGVCSSVPYKNTFLNMTLSVSMDLGIQHVI